MERLQKIEELLEQTEKDNKKLEEFLKVFKKIVKNQKKLDDYYTNDYLEDFDNPDFKNAPYRILDEDSIWNSLTDFYSLRIELLKKITESL
ncbi:MAG: DUF4298 domain-containing protein [Flavobacteriaceae bacterium]|nr:DUF4298 domain-containing protein [Flavobacteriaceae bacterium]